MFGIEQILLGLNLNKSIKSRLLLHFVFFHFSPAFIALTGVLHKGPSTVSIQFRLLIRPQLYATRFQPKSFIYGCCNCESNTRKVKASIFTLNLIAINNILQVFVILCAAGVWADEMVAEEQIYR